MPHPMKNLKIMIRLISYAFLTVVIFAQNKQDKIIGIWEFQTITTLFNSEPEETLIINKDINKIFKFIKISLRFYNIFHCIKTNFLF